MGAKTGIEWTDATWNPIGGCSIKSPGCKHCYAQGLAGTRLKHHPLYADTTTPAKGGKPVFNGTMTVAPDTADVWSWPIKWKGPKVPVRGPGARPLVFVGDMSDLFHENRPNDVVDRVFAVMAMATHIDFQILTKRPELMLRYMVNNPDRDSALRGGSPWPLPNVWTGFSAERQLEFDTRWPQVRALAAMGCIVFVSVEPQLERVTLPDDFLALGERAQLICGGLSGADESPLHPAWPRALRDQCQAAGVPFFFKQWGEWKPSKQRLIVSSGPAAWPDGTIGPGCDTKNGGLGIDLHDVGKKAAGRVLDGHTWSEFPVSAEASGGRPE